MGRGRAKAKQTKVARELKYSNHEPNLEKLQEELSNGSSPYDRTSPSTDDDDADAHEDDDSYAPRAR